MRELEAALQQATQIGRAHAKVIERSLHAVAGEPSLEALCGQLLNTIVTELGADSGAFWLCNEDDEMVARIYLAFEGGRVVRGEDSAHPGREPRPIPEELASHWRRHRYDPVVYQQEDYLESASLEFCREYYVDQGVRTVVTLPLVLGERLFGTFAIRWAVHRALGESDLRLATALAMQSALALQLVRFGQRARDAARAEEREHAAQERAADLGMLNEALKIEVAERRRAEHAARGQAAIILRSLDSIRDQSSVDTFVEGVLKTIVEELGGIGASFWIPEREDGYGRVVFDFDQDDFRRGDDIDHPGREPRVYAHLQESYWGAGDFLPFVMDGYYIDTDPRFAGFRSWANRLGIRTMLAVPLTFRGRLTGVLSIRFVGDHAFSESELQFTRMLSLHATLAQQLARLGNESRETAVLREREAAANRLATDLGSANRILQDALHLLTSEPELNAFMTFVLRSVVERFGAHSSSLQVLYAGGARILFLQNWEGGRLHSAEEYASSPLVRAYEQSVNVASVRDTYERPEARVFTIGESGPPWTPELRKALSDMGVRTIANLPLMIGAKVMGRLVIRFDTERQVGADDLQLMQSIANQVALAMHLTRLAVAGNRSAVLGERTRMARDIHDTLAQGFTGVIVQLEAAKDAICLRRADDADAHIERAAALARQSLAEARRSVHALRPLALEHGSLSAALASMLENMTAGTEIRARAWTEGDAYAIALDWEEHLLRIGQEAISNALRHGTPHGIDLLLRFSPTEIVLEIQDDGIGFDPGRKSDGMGLDGMQGRCAHMRGRFELDTAPGRGVRLRVTLTMDLGSGAGIAPRA